MKKNIFGFNSKAQKHGPCKVFRPNGALQFKGNYINGKQSALCELYSFDGTLLIKRYFIL